jgi:hypothetical protein
MEIIHYFLLSWDPVYLCARYFFLAEAYVSRFFVFVSTASPLYTTLPWLDVNVELDFTWSLGCDIKLRTGRRLNTRFDGLPYPTHNSIIPPLADHARSNRPTICPVSTGHGHRR